MHTLNKNESKNLLRECINLVKKKPADFFILKKLKLAMGFCHWDWIEIDPRKEFLQTSIHECIHFLRPDWSESMVLYAESRIMNQTSYLDLMEFIKCLSSKLYKKEKTKTISKFLKNKSLKKFKNI